MAAVLEQRLADARANRAGGAGDERDVCRSSGGRASSSFACWNARYSILKRSRFGQAEVAAHGGDARLHRSVCAVMSRAIVEALDVLADRERAEARHQEDARQRVGRLAETGRLARCFAT